MRASAFTGTGSPLYFIAAQDSTFVLPRKKPAGRKIWPWTKRRFFSGELKTPLERKQYDIQTIQNRIFVALENIGMKSHTIERIRFQAARGNLVKSIQKELDIEEQLDLLEDIQGRAREAKALFRERKKEHAQRARGK